MCIDRDLTKMTKSLCRSLVKEHIPQQADWFNPIWDAVWHSLPANTVDELHDLPGWRSEDAGGVALSAVGDVSHQAMDALYVIGSVVGAVVMLLNREDGMLIETIQIDKALRYQAEQLGAPDHVRQILETFGTGLLAEQLAAVDWKRDKPSNDPLPSGLLHVEYCHPSCKESQSAAFVTEILSRDEVEKKLYSYSSQFGLYLDESKPLILVKKVEVPWHTLQARHLKYLHLLFQALRHGRIVRYDEVARKVLEDEFTSDDNIRRLKFELNSKLHGALNSFLTVQQGMRYYQVDLAPYCWIKYEGNLSRLLP